MSAFPIHEPCEANDIPASPAEIVTASQFVRRFGHWQQRAQRSPVYILFRGRPRLVLTSIEVMEALLAPHLASRQRGLDPAALLDLIRDIVVVTDAALRVIAASRTARAYFGHGVAPGAGAGMLVPAPDRQRLQRALRDVQSGGAALTVDLPAPRDPDRLLTITIEPHHGGVALLVRDRGGEIKPD